MSHRKIHSALMAVIQDEVSIRSASGKIGLHSQQIKDLISKFEFNKQHGIFKKRKNMIENTNKNHILWWDCYLILFKPGP